MPGWSAATVAISSAITCSAGEAAPPPRSNSNRYFATVQPSSIWPSTFDLGTRTSSKNTWFWISSPDVITSGRIWMPGDVMSISTNVMPCCFFCVRDVRTRAEHPVRFAGVRRPDLAAGAHQVVAVVDRRHRQRRQIRARLGFGVALAEEHLAGQDPRQEVLLLRVRAELDDRVGDHPDAHRRQRRSPGQRATRG